MRTGRGVVLRRCTITRAVDEMRRGRVTLAAHVRRAAIVQGEDAPVYHEGIGFVERTRQDGVLGLELGDFGLQGVGKEGGGHGGYLTSICRLVHTPA